MGCLSDILFLIIIIANSASTNGSRDESDSSLDTTYQDYEANGQGVIDCLTEKQYVKTSSKNTLNITDTIKSQFTILDADLMKLVTKNDLKVEINVIKSILDNMPNKSDTNRLENQLSSLKTEHEDIKLLCKNIDNSSLPSTEDKTQTSSEVIALLKELQELRKAKECDKLSNATGKHFNQPSKQSFEKSDIFGIISVVALVVLFALVILMIKLIRDIQKKLSSMQIQVAHEKYYRRESEPTPKALQLTNPQEQRNGSIVANPVINMYDNSEIKESLMDEK